MLLEWVSRSALSNPLFKPLLPVTLPDNKQPVVVSQAGKPEALFFVSDDLSSGKIECESLKVLNPFDANALLSFLLRGIVDYAVSKKCHTTIFYFEEKAQSTEPLKKALKLEGWSAPEHYIMSCYFDRTFDPPWVHANFRIPVQFSITTWGDLSKEQITKLKEKGRNSLYPPNLSPFKYDNPDPQLSLVLLDEGDVIGWVMTRRLSTSLLAYSAIFVEGQYKMMGLAIPLMTESIKRVKQAVSGGVIDTYMTLSEPHWIEFVNKRLKPYSMSVSNIYRSYKRVTINLS